MTARRSFLTRVGTAAMTFWSAPAFADRSETFGERPLGTQDVAARPDAAGARWQPARDAKDDWFDQIPGTHRLFFDTLTALGLSEAQGFADNYFTGSKSGYGLEAGDLAVVVCLRHTATVFAFTDPFWAKYGAAIGESIKFDDPKTGQPPLVNLHKARLEGLAARGVHFAVCDLASHRYAGAVARRIDGDADAVYKDMTANLILNARFVAAGIIAVNRAQERGYAITCTG
jgi:intracellular sulfur oxidation DsrE/DsrF family protein